MRRERVRQIAKGNTSASAKKKPAQNDPDALLSTAEAAEQLNVHVSTIRRWANKGLLVTYRIGPRSDRRFKRRDIDSFLLKN